jgi:hypothetical protein
MLKLLSTLALLLATSTHAWVGTSSSAFGGRVLANTGGIQNAHSMEMKKSKPNLPPQMRGQYKQQKEMALMRKQMDAASKVGDDGLPVFNLYVRTKKANVSTFLVESRTLSFCLQDIDSPLLFSSLFMYCIYLSIYICFRCGILAEVSRETIDRPPCPRGTLTMEFLREFPRNNWTAAFLAVCTEISTG